MNLSISEFWKILRIPSWLWEFESVSGEDISVDFISDNFLWKISDIDLFLLG